ncbi:MAG TPA: ABC transporter permease subunit [Galbitalea sp.]|jgi:iron(III) transport system permease protein
MTAESSIRRTHTSGQRRSNGIGHWFAHLGGFRVISLIIGLLVAGTLAVIVVRLAIWAIDAYGTGIPAFYVTQVFGNPVILRTLFDTVVVVGVSCTLATFVAGILAWLNERTNASIGAIGRLLPLVPFLMPAISFPLGWVFLTAPQAGLLNVLLRGALGSVGIHVTDGPINIYTWGGMIFLYTIFLSGFAYLVLSSSMRNLDRGLEEAAKMAGAGPVKILFRITLPALRPAMLSAFFLCAIVGLVMVAVPVTIGTSANIPMLSVSLVNMVTTTTPPQYAQAFLIGLLLLIPIVALWLVQRRSASSGRIAVIGGKASAGTKLRLGRGAKVVGRIIFFGYIAVSVGLPLIGLIYVSGVSFWSLLFPTVWNPLTNIASVLTSQQTQPAIMWSVFLGIAAGAVMIIVAHILSYSQRLFPRFGRVIDGLAKSPVIIAQILIAVALLVTFGGPPFRLEGTAWILFIGYLLVFLPFASIITTGAHQEIGRDIVEASTMAGASDTRTFASIVSPLTRPSLTAGFMLLFILISGETNISLILASTNRPVVGFVMVDLFNYGSFPQVASMALVVTVINLILVGLFNAVLGSRLPFVERWPLRLFAKRKSAAGPVVPAAR